MQKAMDEVLDLNTLLEGRGDMVIVEMHIVKHQPLTRGYLRPQELQRLMKEYASSGQGALSSLGDIHDAATEILDAWPADTTTSQRIKQADGDCILRSTVFSEPLTGIIVVYRTADCTTIRHADTWCRSG